MFSEDRPELSNQADAMWKMLDDLAEKDPEEYEKFIKRTMVEAREERAKATGNKGSTNAHPTSTSTSAPSTSSPSSNDSGFFVPAPGFVIVSKCESPSFPSTQIFLNHCSSPSIPMMQNRKGQPATSSTPLAELRIPLSVGRLFNEIHEAIPCKTVDVVFHPSVIDRAVADLNFQLYLVELSMTHTEEDHKIRIHRGYKFVKEMKYKGRYPTAQRTEAAIQANQQQQRTKSTEAKNASSSSSNSKPEIKFRMDVEEPQSSNESILISKEQKKESKKPLIEDLSEPSSSYASSSSSSKSSAASKPDLTQISPSSSSSSSSSSSQASSSRKEENSRDLIGAPLVVKRREKAIPTYSISSNEGNLTIAVELPLEENATNVNAELSKKEFELNSSHYSMKIELAAQVDDSKSTAKFVKKTKTLKISAPIVV